MQLCGCTFLAQKVMLSSAMNTAVRASVLKQEEKESGKLSSPQVQTVLNVTSYKIVWIVHFSFCKSISPVHQSLANSGCPPFFSWTNLLVLRVDKLLLAYTSLKRSFLSWQQNLFEWISFITGEAGGRDWHTPPPHPAQVHLCDGFSEVHIELFPSTDCFLNLGDCQT